MLIRKATAVDELTKWDMWLYHQRHHYIHVTDSKAVTLLSASLLQKISADTDRLCQITLNKKIIVHIWKVV